MNFAIVLIDERRELVVALFDPRPTGRPGAQAQIPRLKVSTFPIPGLPHR